MQFGNRPYGPSPPLLPVAAVPLAAPGIVSIEIPRNRLFAGSPANVAVGAGPAVPAPWQILPATLNLDCFELQEAATSGFVKEHYPSGP